MKTFDEQLADHKTAFEDGTLEPWDVQHARAVASGRPWRDVRDYYIGGGDPMKGRVVIYLTDEEIAEAQQAAAADAAAQAAQPTPAQQLVEQIKSDPAALAALKAATK